MGFKKVHAWVDERKKKYDIVIKIGKIEKKISIKKGIIINACGRNFYFYTFFNRNENW